MSLIHVRVRSMREERGLSLRELALAIHIPFGTLGKKERGEHQWKLEELARCAQQFGVCLCQVLTMEHPANEREP